MTEEQMRERAWYETDLGKLFRRFEDALGKAWCTDQRESASNTSMKRDWGKADEARADLLKAIRGW